MYGTQQILGELHRREWGRIVAAVARQVRDLDLAEECTQDAFAAALVDWDRAGVVPASPRAWLITAARRRAIDRIRQQRVRAEHAREELALGDESSSPPESLRDFDDRLRLLFTCCHPALPVDAQVALTLRVLLGMTTDEIARAFLAPVPTIQQRIVRAKQTIAELELPYEVPEGAELPERAYAVLTALYLVFNEGHTASRGTSLVRVDLCEEAISLTRGFVQGLPDEAGGIGLLGLMLLTHARRAARVDAAGELVTLDEQDRTLWDRAMADEGRALVKRALELPPLTRFAIQGAVAAVHADAARAEDTDWAEIAALYAVHLRIAPSPIVELNAAVAHALAHDVDEGLRRVLALEEALSGYLPFHAARADLLRRCGRITEAREAYLRAAELSGAEPERRYLRARAEAIAAAR